MARAKAGGTLLQQLTTPDGRWRWPVVFMTNGGGVCEERKARQLSEWLGAHVSASQVLLSHTPMRDLVPELGDQPVLVSGRGDVLNVARSYGFRSVLHARELGRAMPTATPFTKYPDAPMDGPCPVRDLGLATERRPLAAVLVMTDPDDWYRDAQLICDVLTGGGIPERPAASAVAAGGPHVRLIFSNPDLLWANEFPKNRFGQGAFAHMVLSLYSRLTGGARPHSVTFYGKPNPQPYRLAERLLLEQARQLGLPLPEGPPGALPFSGIYAVGDNPAADVRGANQAGAPWVSVLVRTGVFQGPGPNCDIDTARVAVDDVEEAVDAALHRTRSSRWHSMR